MVNRTPIRIDIEAFYELQSPPSRTFIFRSLLSEPGILFIFLARLQLRFAEKGFRKIARLVHLLNLRLTGGEVSMSAVLEQPIVAKHPLGILIGENVHIGKGVTLLKGVTFGMADVKNNQPARMTIIGKDCIIGTNAVILDGITIGDNCVVGANAVVTRSFASNQVLVGVPARNLE